MWACSKVSIYKFAFHFNSRPYDEAETEFETFGSKPNTCCIIAGKVFGTFSQTEITALLCDIEAEDVTICNPTPGEGFNVKVEGFDRADDARNVRDQLACLCSSGILEFDFGSAPSFRVFCVSDITISSFVIPFGYCGGVPP